jgi:hypothetical protein
VKFKRCLLVGSQTISLCVAKQQRNSYASVVVEPAVPDFKTNQRTFLGVDMNLLAPPKNPPCDTIPALLGKLAVTDGLTFGHGEIVGNLLWILGLFPGNYKRLQQFLAFLH